MLFMCPNCQKDGEVIDFDFSNLSKDEKHVRELHIRCPHCNHWITLNKPNDIIDAQLETIQECYDIGVIPKEIYESVTILIRQGYAYLSGIDKRNSMPIICSTEAGDALAEWWDDPETH